LKPANILVTETCVPKISDFGCSRFKKEDINMTQIGTPIYAAPEVIMGDKYDEKCDIYSYAIILVGIAYTQGNLDNLFIREVAKRHPNESRNANNIMKLISEGLRPALHENCPTCIKELIGQCWQGKPTLRPSAVELLQILQHIVRPQLITPEDKKFDAKEAVQKADTVRASLRRRSQASLMPNGVSLAALEGGGGKMGEVGVGGVGEGERGEGRGGEGRGES